jgi:group I intron endonuclease
MGRIEWLYGPDKKMAIYAIVNTINGKLYVGSSRDVRARWREHLNYLENNKHSNNYLQHSFNKYGRDAFEFHIIQEVNEIEQLITAEQYWIDFTKCCDRRFGYNIEPTADRSTRSAETIAKISVKNKGKVRSAEARAKYSRANKGKILSEETRGKLRAINLGKTMPEETRKKIGESLKGRVFTASHRAKIGAAWKGRKHTEETRQKMIGMNSPLTPDGVREIRRRYAAGESRFLLAEQYGVHPATIWNIIKRKTWSGLEKEEYEPGDTRQDDIQAAIGLLKHTNSPRRRTGARQLCRLQAPEAGPALLDALQWEVRDWRTWKTQYHMILALGECEYCEALPFLWELAAREFEASMVYVALGDAIVRLGRSEANDGTPIYAIMETGNEMLIDGAFRAMAMLHMVPDQQTIDHILDLASPMAGEADLTSPSATRVDLRFWVAAAAPGWPGRKVRQFLETCLLIGDDQLRHAAQAALQRKYLNWTLPVVD